MFVSRSPVLFLPLSLILLLGLSLTGCSDDPTGASDPASDEARVTFDGRYEDGEVVLQRISGPEGVALDLVATDIRVGSGAGPVVEVDVALRNASARGLFGPVRVFLGRFVPTDVVLMNGDEQLVDPPNGDPLPGADWPYPHFFVYAEELGDDGMMLGPGETSDPRTWRFEVPDLGGFSFGSEAQVGLTPDRPMIGGLVFEDTDRDGLFDPNEPVAPFGRTGLIVQFPSGRMESTRTDDFGRWRLPLTETGIHRVTWLPPPTLQFAPLCLTTPNPLQVVIVAGADGGPRSFLDADFGIDPEPCLPPAPTSRVQLFSGPADSLRSDPYTFIDAIYTIGDPISPDGVASEYLEVTIGFSGCGPDHPVALFAGADFMESQPPQTWLRIVHDDRDELCDAWFEETRAFDLAPLRRRQLELYGTPGPLILVLETFDGQTVRFELP